MAEINNEKNKSLEVRCNLNKGKEFYYRGNKVVFNIEIINNSPDELKNIIFHQSFPKNIKPNCNNQFSVYSSCGDIVCTDTCVIIAIEKITANEIIVISIEGVIYE